MKLKNKQTHSNIQGQNNGSSWGIITKVGALGNLHFISYSCIVIYPCYLKFASLNEAEAFFYS